MLDSAGLTFSGTQHFLKWLDNALQAYIYFNGTTNRLYIVNPNADGIIALSGNIGSTLIPSQTNTYSLGNSSKNWDNLWIRYINNCDIGYISEIIMKEVAGPTAPPAAYGSLYTKSDNKLYFYDGDGGLHEIAFV